MYKKISVILVLFTACSLFQQEEQAVVSVADTDKGKEAMALGVELVDEREEISDEDVGLSKEPRPDELPLDEKFVEVDWQLENAESDAAPD